MSKNFLTDEDIESEIARLSASENVKLARKELRYKYKRRQILYTLRNLEKRGAQLALSGVTLDNINDLLRAAEEESKGLDDLG